MSEPTIVADGVLRLTAPNPGPMTYLGTNTYLIGAAGVAVIDPGPDAARHRDAILQAAEARGGVAAIVVTHSHIDHTAGVASLAAACGAPVYAFGDVVEGRSPHMQALANEGLDGGEGVDWGFAPDRRLRDGDVVEGAGWRLAAIHTPGHLADHLCFALGDALFTGDLVMGWSTSIVSPPDGDMGAFMASLDRLAARSDRRYLPGHGDPIETPADRVSELAAHRRGREAQILAALQDGPAAARALVARIYTDVAPYLHAAAERNVLAHLIDLWERDLIAPMGAFRSDVAFARRDG